MKCRFTHPILIWILAFCLCNALFFVFYSVEPNLLLTLVPVWWLLCAALAGHHEISIARRLHKTFVVPFLHIPFWKDKALIDKPMFVQVGSFCTSIPRMSRICHLAPLCNKISWFACVVKVLHDEYFGSRPVRPLTPLVLNFSFAVIMSKLNPIDHKSITARLLIPFSWSFSWIDWVWLSERDDKQCWDRILERTRVCV